MAAAVERGLVERRAHPVHGRVLQLFLTASGQEKYQQAAQAVAELERDLSASTDEEARELFWRELRAITERAEAIGGRGGRLALVAPGPPT